MRVISTFFLILSIFVFGIFAQDTKDKTGKKRDKDTNDKKVEKVNKEDNSDKQDEKKSKFTVNADNTKSETLPVEVDSSLLALASSKSNTKKYKIGFQDVLQVTVFRHSDLNSTINVNSDGTINLPRINQPIVAVCKTERELATLITKLYTKDFLRNPFVTVRTIEQRSQPFAVIGAVNKPGNFFLNQRIRLLSLLALAGGQDVEKSGSRIQVARVGNLSACNPTDDSDTDIEFKAYELNDVLSGKSNPWMQPGDIVSILEAEEAYVIGEVVEPEKILLKSPITLTEAIAKAGGVNSTAKISRVIIQRKESGSDQRNEIEFNLKDIYSKKISDPYLQANDIVVVASSTTKKLKNGFFNALTNGLPNIFYRLP